MRSNSGVGGRRALVCIYNLIAANVLSGLGELVGAVNRQSLIQHLAPDYALGRVVGSQLFMILLGNVPLRYWWSLKPEGAQGPGFEPRVLRSEPVASA